MEHLPVGALGPGQLETEMKEPKVCVGGAGVLGARESPHNYPRSASLKGEIIYWLILGGVHK